MRLATIASLGFLGFLAAGCGTDISPQAPDGGTSDGTPSDGGDAGTPPDGSPGDTGSPGDAGVDAGMPLTRCEAAASHDDLAWIQANVFTPSCASSECHGRPSGPLDLRSGRSWASLVGQPSTTQSGWIRVVAGDSVHSYLMVAIGAAAGPQPRDGVMPLGKAPLCDPIKAAIGRWIDAGALP